MMKKFNIFIILPTAVLVYGDFNKYSSPFAPIVRNTCRAHVSFTCVPNSATTLYEVIYVASKIAYMYCATNLLCNIHSMPIQLWSAHKNKQNKLSHPFVHGPSQSILLVLSSYATLAMGTNGSYRLHWCRQGWVMWRRVWRWGSPWSTTIVDPMPWRGSAHESSRPWP
jgi:hypothetical protein